MLIWTLAWRNIFRHKGKTIVIGTILFFGAFVMTIGNGIIAGMDYGLKQNIVDQFSGDIVLLSNQQLNTSVLASMSGQTIAPIAHYPQLKHALKQRAEIASILPAGVGYVWVLNDAGQPIDQYLLGVDIVQYDRFFSNSLSVIEGRKLAPGEKGVMVPKRMRKWLYDYSGFWVVPVGESVKSNSAPTSNPLTPLDIRHELIFLGLSQKNASLDVLTPVTGIITFRALNGLLGFYSIVDIDSFRECMGFFSDSAQTPSLSGQDQSILSSENPDMLFETDVSSVQSQDLTMNPDWFVRRQTTPLTRNADDGVFNLVFVKLKPHTDLAKTVVSLNQWFKAKQLPVQAVSWQKATGMLGQTATIMKVALLLFVSFIFFVAVIVIMNTLSMAAMERVSEIGMMRAVGARQWFVSRLFLTETGILSIMFGGLGILAGFALIGLFSVIQINTQNEMLQILFGGDTFMPRIEGSMILMCLIQLAIVSMLSVIYPVIVARRISPLQAISRE